MVRAELAERFLSAPIMAGFEPAVVRLMLDALVEESAGKGDVLLTQGQPNDHLSFLIDGSATVERARPGPDGRPGKVETLATLTAPSVFGATSFFRLDPPNFTVRAAGDVQLLTVYHPAHDRLRRDHPAAAESLAVAALNVLAGRLDELDHLFTDYIAGHPDDPRAHTEWAGFRARLFEEPND